MTLTAAILALLAQDPFPYGFADGFEERMPDAADYDGWSPVIDALHPEYNKAGRYRAADDRRITLNDDAGTVLVGPILREDDKEHTVTVNTGRGPKTIRKDQIVSNEPDPTRRPRGGDHAVSIRCYRGAGAFRTDRGFLGSGLHPMAVDPDYAYRLGAYVKFVRNDRNRATISLRWLDVTGEPLGEDRSSPLAVAPDWSALELSVPGVDARARFVQIVLRVEGPDVDSECLFDDVRLVAQPRIRVTPVGRATFVYAPKEKVEADIAFRDGVPKGMRLDVSMDGATASFGPGEASRDASGRFTFTPRRPGYYELHARLTAGDRTITDERVPVASVGTLGETARGDLGLTLNPYSTRYDDPQELLERLHVAHVKVVLWERGAPRGGGTPTLAMLGEFVDRVNVAAPEIVGVFGRAPDFLLPATASRFALAHPWALFAEPREEWERALRRTLAQTGRVDVYQVGADFADTPPPVSGAGAALAAVIPAIKEDNRDFNKVGLAAGDGKRPAGVDFAAVELVPDAMAASSDHLVYRLPVPAAGGDGTDVIAAMIKAIALARARGDLPGRVYLPLEDLDRRGLLTADGQPRPALAAFPILNEALANTVAAKGLRLFNATEAIFEKLGSPYATIVAWSDGEPVRQVVFAGDDARLIDHFGRDITPRPGEPVVLGPMPVYLIDVDKELLRTQSSLAFDPDAVALQLRDSILKLGFTNHFSLAMKNVRITVETDERGWTIDPRSMRAIGEVPAGEAAPAQTVRMRPPEWSRTGETVMRIGMTFRVGDRDYRFTTSRAVVMKPVVEPIITGTLEADGGASIQIALKDHTTAEGGGTKTIQVTTKLPGRPAFKSFATVAAGQSSAPLTYRVADVASLPDDAAIEVTLYQADGDRVIGTVRKLKKDWFK